jgi:hypothetical protein
MIDAYRRHSMAGRKIKISRAGGVPNIEVVIGYANWGTYKIKIWDENGKNPQVIGEGFSGDDISDLFSIGSPAALQGKTLSWKVRVAAPEEGETNQYHITVLLKQDGKILKDGLYTYADQFDGVKTVGDFAIFELE